MNIEIKETKEFSPEDLGRLFKSVNWSSGDYPDSLKIAMQNSDTVISAWDGDKLVGLVNALSDGVMTAYFHYLLVDPDYQGKGIGKSVLNQILSRYEDYARKVLIAYDDKSGFYKSMGFSKGEGSIPMFITCLTT